MRESDQRLSHSYAAGGVFITIPIFTGGRLTAEEHRSAYEAQAADRDLEAERNSLSRDVQVAWDSAQTAYRNIAVTGQLLDSSTKALDLTKARYDIGSSSIVEVEQAEVSALEAQIAQSNATYDYLIERAFLGYREGEKMSSAERCNCGDMAIRSRVLLESMPPTGSGAMLFGTLRHSVVIGDPRSWARFTPPSLLRCRRQRSSPWRAAILRRPSRSAPN